MTVNIEGLQIVSTRNALTDPPYLVLETIATYLRDYITTDLRNPNFYAYLLDGTSYSITDGGNDMYDVGNFTGPWLRANVDYTQTLSIPVANSVNYSNTTSTIMDTDFYYVSLGYSTSPDRRPLTVLGTRSGSNNAIGFQKAGNIGADGSGFLVSGDIYTGNNVNGFTVHAFYRQSYGQASDPAICDLYMLIGHPNWDSTFGAIRKYSNPSTQNNNGFYYTIGNQCKNILAIATLLSRPANLAISEFDIRAVVDNYTLRIKEALSF
jgi:hypothetical protein